MFCGLPITDNVRDALPWRAWCAAEPQGTRPALLRLVPGWRRERAQPAGKGLTAVTFVITGGCCNDASCVPVCPVQCIRPRPGDPDFTSAEQLYIDPATCIDCGACMDECPVSAIHGEWDLPEELDDYLAINAEYFANSPIEESAPPDRKRRKLAEGSQLRVAVVGSGPAGCYAASDLSDIKGVEVSVFDRLPTPFGLVRAGVAPDHANTKQISKRFGAVLARSDVHCYFNVEVGRDVTIDELLEHHHALIWAGGATSDRRLGIPGEDLEGCLSAREFVAWYNGHPEHSDRKFDFSTETAVVIGNGNVALDVARVLARPAEALESTDVATHALDALKVSQIEKVLVTARRGPEHAAYTSGELASLIHNTPGVKVTASSAETQHLAKRTDRAAQLVKELPEASFAEKGIALRYGLTPVEIRGSGSVEEVVFRDEAGNTEVVATSLVVKAIGYRGSAIPELPFDESGGTLPNMAGRVVDPESGDPLVGRYCSGWIKRGATGMIGTNKTDSGETVEAVLHDFEAGRLTEPLGPRDDLARLLASRQASVVDNAAWVKIDQAERAAGKAAGRPRLKLVTLDELLAAAAVRD
jgi:ferredoxin--NADP+ reductase